MSDSQQLNSLALRAKITLEQYTKVTLKLDSSFRLRAHGVLSLKQLDPPETPFQPATPSGGSERARMASASSEADPIDELIRLKAEVEFEQRRPVRLSIDFSCTAPDRCIELASCIPSISSIDLWTGFESESLKFLRRLRHLAALRLHPQPDFHPAALGDGFFKRLGRLQSLRSIVMPRHSLTDEGIRLLTANSELESISAPGGVVGRMSEGSLTSSITNRSTKHLAVLRNLKKLDLSFTEISNEGLFDLGKLRYLKSLSLAGENLAFMAPLQSSSRISGSGLSHLAPLRDLEVLNLNITMVGSLQHVRNLTSVRELYLGNTRIDSGQLHYLLPLTRLRVLNLTRGRITDAGIESIRQLRRLQRLSLYGTEITDVGLAQLRPLQALRHLDIRYTNVTRRGVDALRRALPRLAIQHNTDR